MEPSSAIKKNDISPSETVWRSLEGTVLSELCQTEEDKHHVIHVCVESKAQNTQQTK